MAVFLSVMYNAFHSIHAAENSARTLHEHLRLNFSSGWNVARSDFGSIVIGTLGEPPQGILVRSCFIIPKKELDRRSRRTNCDVTDCCAKKLDLGY